MLTGFWHGAAWTFILWGLFFAVLLMAEKLLYLKRLESMKILPHIYKILFVAVSFVLFDSASVGAALQNIGAMFGLSGLPLWSFEAGYYLKSYAVILVLGLIGSTPLLKSCLAKAAERPIGEKVLNVLEPIALLALLVLCTGYLVDGSFNPFLYFRF